MKLSSPMGKSTWLKWKQFVVFCETQDLEQQNIRKKILSTSGKMILPLINFRSWAQIEFVIKEAVKRAPNKSVWFQIYLGLKMV